MLDRAVRRVIDPCLEPVAAILQRVGLTANAVTVLGFLLGLLGCVAIAVGWLWLGLVLVLGNRLADGLDGILARRVRRQCAGSGGIVGGVTAEAVGGNSVSHTYALSGSYSVELTITDSFKGILWDKISSF